MNTLESLSALTDEQLIEKVAMEVMGWKCKDTGSGGLGWYIRTDTRTDLEGKHYTTTVYREYVNRWNPITDMNHTLEVWTRMGPGWQLSQADVGGWTDDQRWWCWLPKEYGGDGTIVMQPTPQRAICLASLLAVSKS